MKETKKKRMTIYEYLELHSDKSVCKGCGGLGYGVAKKCEDCKGMGVFVYSFRDSYDCKTCNGTGYIKIMDCPFCNGKGYRDWIDQIKRPILG